MSYAGVRAPRAREVPRRWCCKQTLLALDSRGHRKHRYIRPTTVVTVVVGELRVMEVERCDNCAQDLVNRLREVDGKSPLYGAQVSVRPIATSRSSSPTTAAA